MSESARLDAGGAVIWHDAAAFPGFEPRLFDPAWLRAEGFLTGGSTGRNTAHFLRHEGREMVLRHYWRGGLVGRVVRDLFLRVPVARSRAMREYALLDWMRAAGLPVPRPLAARFVPLGPAYRADLLMELVPGTATLADRIAAAPLPLPVWKGIGGTVARMHRLGVDHSDLNCRNILLDGQEAPWLIDFDKCARRAPGAWAPANLARLERSLAKEKACHSGLHWGPAERAALLDGYREG